MKTNLVVPLAVLALTFQVHAQRCVETPAGLVSQYRFEEGAPDQPATDAGSILDFVDGSGDGTPTGAPLYRTDVGWTRVAACQCETNALSLELGEGQSVKINSPFIFHDQYGDATLEFLVKPAQQWHVGLFWTRPDNDDRDRFNIAINSDGGFGFDYRSPSGELHAGDAAESLFRIPLDAWTHIAVVRDTQSSAPAHTYSFYVNGVYRVKRIDPNPYLPTSNQEWQISGREGFFFTGSVDEIRFSARKLAPSEFLISALIVTIVRNADQTVSLSWCGAGTLERTESLTTPNWQPAPSQANPQTISTTSAMKFYRVKAE